MDAVAKAKPGGPSTMLGAALSLSKGGKGYVIEWAVSFNPCLEIAPGTFFTPGDKARTNKLVRAKEVRMGLNIALGDLDEREKGVGNFGHFHHEDWFAGRKNTRTQLRDWGTLRLMPGPRPMGVK
jgi:hypothetical protein